MAALVNTHPASSTQRVEPVVQYLSRSIRVRQLFNSRIASSLVVDSAFPPLRASWFRENSCSSTAVSNTATCAQATRIARVCFLCECVSYAAAHQLACDCRQSLAPLFLPLRLPHCSSPLSRLLLHLQLQQSVVDTASSPCHLLS